MKLTDLLLNELEREAPRTRRVLEHVPEGRDEWRPHPRSMPLGRLASLVATMPSWVTLTIRKDELDLNPPGGPGTQPSFATAADLAAAMDRAAAEARDALKNTSDDFLLTTNWRLLVGGMVVMNEPRHIVLRDSINHWAHHRGQLTVYLRLNNAKVPSIYGPSADDQEFR
jgi:uncharacterized damage-inducible protein DinB